jgi:hypothetical protein
MDVKKSFDFKIGTFDESFSGFCLPLSLFLDEQANGDTPRNTGSNEKRGRRQKDRLAGAVSQAVQVSTLADTPFVGG